MRLVPEPNSLARWLALPFLVVAAAGAVFATWRPEFLYRLARCPWRDMTGLPCPTCGGTHAAVALAGGRWGEAWAANPAVPLGAVAVLLWSLWAVLAAFVPALRVRPRFSTAEKRATRLGVALLLAGLWIRQIVVL